MTTTTTDRRWVADMRERHAAEYANDHHWNPQHPDYDPDCICGDPSPRRVVSGVPGEDAAASQPRRTLRHDSPSSKQLSYLSVLIDNADEKLVEPSIIEACRIAMTSNDRSKVSDAIETLNELTRNNAETAARRPNRYPGTCRICSAHVPAQAGHIAKVNGQWVVYCGPSEADCGTRETRDRQAAAAADTPSVARSEPARDSIDLSALPSGRYAVPGGETRLKVKIDNLIIDTPRNPKWAGYVFVSDAAEYGRGQRYGTQRPGQRYDGDVIDALRVIAADPRAALAAYGQLTGRCGACNRKLEDETSVALGIGPVCRTKH